MMNVNSLNARKNLLNEIIMALINEGTQPLLSD